MQVQMNILDFLHRGANVYPDRIAFVDEPKQEGGLGELTYGSFFKRVLGLAKTLEDMGVTEGDRVAILSPNATKFAIALFATSGFGKIFVPINFRLNAKEVEFVITHSGASVLLVDPEYEEMLSNIQVKEKIVLDGVRDKLAFEPLKDGSSEPTRWECDENATCSINYTSGTTAQPKGVEVTHRNMWLNATMFGWHTGVCDSDVYLHTLPLFHANGWGMPYALAGMGAKNIILRKVDGEDILSRIQLHGVTLMCGAPAVWSLVLQAAEKRLAQGLSVPGRDSVRIVAAGAPPPSKMIERLQDELGWEFIQIYGLTETSPVLTVNRYRREWATKSAADRAKLLSMAGVPIIGTSIEVDSTGEVLARGNQVFKGYWNNSEATQEAIDGGWFRTGDGGHMVNSYLAISDRKKDVIISGGENVSSIEVEDTIFQLSDILEVAVIGVPDDKWGETVKALVVKRPDSNLTEIDVINFCRSNLAHYKCPTSVEFRTELIRTPTGKLQKFKLREPYWAGRTKLVN